MNLLLGKLGNWLYLALFGAAWGFSFPLSKVAVSSGHQPAGLVFWQLIVSVVVLGGVILALKLPLSISKHGMQYYLGLTLTGTLVPAMFSYTAFINLPAGIVAITIATVPMFSLLIALVWRTEKFQITRMVGISLGVLALMLIALPEASLPDPDKRWYLLVALVAPFLYGLEGNFVGRYSPVNANPISSLFLASVIGAIIIAPIAIGRGEFIDMTQNVGKPELAILISGVFHAVAYSGYIWLIGRGGPVFTSQISYFVTSSAVFISWLALGEKTSHFIWIALVLMLVALRLVRPGPVKPEGLRGGS